MQMLTKRFGVLTGFVLMVLVLVVNGFIIRRQLATQVANQRWASHTRHVLLELAQTESLYKDAETGQRGFLYTDDSKYLVPYTEATHQIAQHLDVLQQLTADNADQQRRLSTLRASGAKKLSELAQTISLATSGKAGEAKALVLSDLGLRYMADIHKTIADMTADEEALYTARRAAYQKSVQTTLLCLYMAGAVAGLGLIVLAYYILCEMKLRERHARQLFEREEWFRVTLTSLGDAVIATDDQGDVKYLNPLAEQLIGLKTGSVIGRPITEVFPIFNEATLEPVENPVAKVMELGRIVGLANHTVLRHNDGSLTPIEDSASPIRDHSDNLIGVVLVFRDATQERRNQEILRESEKLASAARMSATVAHEINNPLESVGNLVYIAKGTPGIPGPAVEALEIAEQELERVAHITKQTLGFYREFRIQEYIDLQSLIEYVLRLYSRKLTNKNIAVEHEFDACPPVKGLQGEIKQVISNLISNAIDAVDEDGSIRITLSCIEEAHGKAVRIIIADDGPGIPAEYLERIFEPFFTTKKDVGNGLGLWVTKEIVDRHNGRIHIDVSKETSMRGAAFNVFLPCEGEPPSHASLTS